MNATVMTTVRIASKDSCQHRERGHRQGDAQEQREHSEPYVARGQYGVEHERETRSQKKRQDDARMGDGERGVTALPDDRQVELEPDQEQIENHAELGVDAEEGGDTAWQKPRVHFRREPPEQ
jgi:hypothetical protein